MIYIKDCGHICIKKQLVNIYLNLRIDTSIIIKIKRNP